MHFSARAIVSGVCSSQRRDSLQQHARSAASTDYREGLMPKARIWGQTHSGRILISCYQQLVVFWLFYIAI